MSFVISESKRELDFFMNKRQSVGPEVGPGAYSTALYFQPKNAQQNETRVPFGSGQRRHLQSNHMEFMQDLMQFRIIPLQNKGNQHSSNNNSQAYQQHNQTMPTLNAGKGIGDEGQRRKKKSESVIGRDTSFIQPTNISKASFISNQKRMFDSIMDQAAGKQHGLARSESKDQQLVDQSSLSSLLLKQQQKQKAKSKQNNKNLNRILGMLNIQKGATSIQSEKVRIIDDQDNYKSQQSLLQRAPSMKESSSFFLTEQQQITNAPYQSTKHDTSQQQLTNRKIDENDTQQADNSVKKKQASLGSGNGALNWNKSSLKPSGFVNDTLKQKSFMRDVGPGSYDTNISTQIYPVYKHNPTATFQSNTYRLQEMLRLKKEQEQVLMSEQKQKHLEESKHSFSINYFRSHEDYRDANISIQNNQRHNSESKKSLLSRQRLLNNSHHHHSVDHKLKDSPQKKERLQLLNKYQMQLKDVGPAKYNVKKDFTGHSDISCNDNAKFKQPIADRFQQAKKDLELKSMMPGPGAYEAYSQEETTVNIKFPGFGQKQVRELNLINKAVKDQPGPGQYRAHVPLDELLSNCDDKQLVSEILNHTQQKKQNFMFKSNAPRTVVFTDKSKASFQAQDHFYSQSANTINQQQNEKILKQLGKIATKGSLSNYNSTNVSQYNNRTMDGIASNDIRFKEDKRGAERSNVGPGTYYTGSTFDQTNACIKSNGHNISRNSNNAVFRSQVDRGLKPAMNQLLDDPSFNIPTNSQSVTISHYNNKNSNTQMGTWEKKSFNMKYNAKGKQMRNKNSTMISQQLHNSHLVENQWREQFNMDSQR